MFKSITPKFINALDAYLLVNYPVLWMSKIHYALWHGAVLWVISALLGAVMPINLKENIHYDLWNFLLTVLGVVIMCFWVYRYVIFNKEKNYGKRSVVDEYKNFVLVFFSVTIFLLLPWPFEIIYNQRVAHMYTDEEVIADINTLNENDPYLVNSTNNYYSWYDSVTKIQYFNIRQLNPYNASYYTPYILQADSAQHPHLLTAFQLYKKYKPVTNETELEKKIRAFTAVAGKYNCAVTDNVSTLAKKYLSLLKRDRIPSSEFYAYVGYQYDLNHTFSNLCRAKFETLFIHRHDYLWVMFYFIISISSFLMLFKMTYWPQFIIMLVVLMLYPLLMFIFSQLVPHTGFMRDSGFFEASMLALVIFSAITLFITNRNNITFLPFYTIFNQVFYVCLIYIPLLVLVFLKDNTNVFHNHDYYDYIYGAGDAEAIPVSQYQDVLSNEYWAYWQAEYERWVTILKYGGILFFIIALPFFNNLFVKQISLPRKN